MDIRDDKHPGDNECFQEQEWLEEEEQYKSNNPAKKVIAIILIISFLSLMFPQIALLISGKFDFLQNRISPIEDLQLSNAIEAVVFVETRGEDMLQQTSHATGFNIAKDGFIITNRHVVENTSSVKIEFQDGRIYYSSEINVVEDADIAFVKIAGNDLPVLSLEMQKQPNPGEIVSIIGNPLGIKQVILQGDVMGYYKKSENDIPILVVDADCKPGSSGSPIINEEGSVVGIVFAVTANPEENKNATLAYPIYFIKDYLKK